MIALRLLRETSLGSKSRWAPYLAALPASIPQVFRSLAQKCRGNRRNICALAAIRRLAAFRRPPRCPPLLPCVRRQCATLQVSAREHLHDAGLARSLTSNARRESASSLAAKSGGVDSRFFKGQGESKQQPL